MSETLARLRGPLVLGASALLLSVAAWWLVRPVEARQIAGWPAPEELDTLSRYLSPAQPAPRLDEYQAYLPAAAEPVRSLPAPQPTPPVSLRLSAVLITGDRPMAIINDIPVAPGARLPGGAEVVSIEREQVVVRDPDGTRRTLRLSPEAGAGPHDP